MNLITVSNKYSIIIEEYEKIRIGDTFPSKNELLRNICYPKIKDVGTTEKRLFPIIDKIISHEKVKPNGNKIIIKSIEPTSNAEKIIDNELKAAIAKAFKTSTVYAPRQNYSPNRDFLLDYIILQNNSNPQYITSSEIVKSTAIFPNFYYDYKDIHYDKGYSTIDEILLLQNFAENHSLSEDYLIDTMEELSDIIYKIFKRDNLFSWAKRNGIAAERVLCKGSKELTSIESDLFTENYIQPLEEKGVPAKSRIRIANRQYIKDYKIKPINHKWFYYAYKLTKPNEILIMNDEEFIHHQTEINRKIIERLKSKMVDKKGGNYHKSNINDFNYIINQITL